MPDFNWKERPDTDWADRFPDWAIGLWVWREYVHRMDGGHKLLDTLSDLWDQPGIRRTIECPRLFISHKQCDHALARRIAWVAKQQGFDYWLDVEDPLLASLTRGGTGALGNTTVATIIACVIEMALLNCTHVAAVFSPSTEHSRWVPYEFGRVKDKRLISLKAASWVHPSLSLSTSDFPEYLHLGQIARNEVDLEDWLSLEMVSWTKRHNCCHQGSQYLWEGPEPGKLPEG